MKSRLLCLALGAATLFFGGCAQKDEIHTMRISVADQKMTLYRYHSPIAVYDVSTSKFGVGDQRGSYRTPLGRMTVAKKIGDGAPIGMKFKSRRATGEIVKIDAPGRDPIVTRILWLKGLEPQNAHAYDRGIYIHGTAEERNIGRPVSYGCVRMRSRDVISLFNTVGEGAKVEIVPGQPKPAALVATSATPAAKPAPGTSGPAPR